MRTGSQHPQCLFWCIKGSIREGLAHSSVLLMSTESLLPWSPLSQNARVPTQAGLLESKSVPLHGARASGSERVEMGPLCWLLEIFSTKGMAVGSTLQAMMKVTRQIATSGIRKAHKMVLLSLPAALKSLISNFRCAAWMTFHPHWLSKISWCGSRTLFSSGQIRWDYAVAYTLHVAGHLREMIARFQTIYFIHLQPWANFLLPASLSLPFDCTFIILTRQRCN